MKRLSAVGVVAATLVGSLACGGEDDPHFGSSDGSSGGVGAGSGDGGAATAGAGVGGEGGRSDCTEEICDGLDNDCDAEVDEGCPCEPGEQQDCYSGPPRTLGIGACAAGTQTCGPDGRFGTCEGAVLPQREDCNFEDDDCDGAFDEDLGTHSCGVGACATTVESCKDGMPNVCTPLPPTAEKCDGLDNDCDGVVDDGDPDGGGGCLTGLDGVCSQGTFTCSNGKQVCAQNIGPTNESCDALDNDCDGAIDDGNPGGGAMCPTGLPGACNAGVLTCTMGVFSCAATVQPSPEACDGGDNDCNGTTDEGNPGGGGACNTGLPGVCAQGTVNCIGGVLFCSQTTPAVGETCDGLDNDCNTIVDDAPEGWGACSTGLMGPCAAGTLVCGGGSLTCQQNVVSMPETCDGVDNDCDGTTDDGNPGGGGSCSTGLLGPCAAGTLQCTNGQIQCTQSVQPTAEICANGIDDDCNGQGDPIVVVHFSEDFSDNLAGWTLDAEWQIGPTTVSPPGQGNPDPALDHTPTPDNGVAGAVIGGNVAKTIHPLRYLTSPVVDVSAAPLPVYVRFWRWLNSDYVPYMKNTIEVYDGTSWIVVWQSGAPPPIFDSAWMPIIHDISPFKNANLRVRFGFDVGSSGVYTISGWNVDDFAIQSGVCF